MINNSTLQQPSDFLHTKFEIPNLTHRIVRRDRLTSQLLATGERKVSLIVSPAGYGKTTLLCESLSRKRNSDHRVAWITLDLFDNSPVRFWAYFFEALKKAIPQFKFPVNDLNTYFINPSDFTILDPLINEIGRLPCYLYLILDDFHFISDQNILDSLTYLFEHQPRNLHIIISSRTKPDLPFARLRTQGRFTELSANDLAFSMEETKTYLSQLANQTLTIDQIAEINQLMQGWVAGLQMAAISMEHQYRIDDDLISELKDHDDFADYFSQEVLSHQDLETQDFLLATSILNDFSAPLCNELLKKNNCQKIIEYLLANNLFVVSIDRQQRWYRYHPLFAKALTIQLEKRNPEKIPYLHEIAMDWLIENGYPEKAIIHALQTQHLSKAAEIIDNVASEAINNHNLSTLVHWIDTNFDSLVELRPGLGIYQATAFFLLGQFNRVEENLIKTEKAMAKISPEKMGAHEKNLLAWDIQAIRTILISIQGDLEKFLKQSEKVLSDHSKQTRYLYAVLVNSIGITYDRYEQFNKALPYYQQGYEFGIQHQFTYGYFQTMCAIALVFKKQGKMVEAIKEFEKILTFIKERGLESKTTLVVDSFLLEIALEQNEILWADELAREMIDIYHKTDLNESDWISETNFGLYLTNYYANQKDFSLAHYYFDLAVAKYPNIKWSSFLFPTELIEVYVRLLRSEARAEKKETWFGGMDKIINTESLGTNLGRLAHIKILQDQRKYEEAVKLTLEFLELTDESEFLKWGIEAKLLLGLSYYSLHQKSLAFQVIHEVLKTTSKDGLIRVFTDENEPMKDLICEYRTWAGNGMTNQINSDYMKRLTDALDAECSPASLQQAADTPCISSIFPMQEPFSAKEKEIFDLLASNKSTKEIAGLMSVSLNTTRTHIKNIYRKFGVHSQKMLIEKAADLNLLK